MALAWLLSGRCLWHGAVLGSAHLSEALQSATFTASGGFSCELSHISSFASGGPLHCVAPVPPPARLPGWHNGTTGWLPSDGAHWGSIYPSMAPEHTVPFANGTLCCELHSLYAGSRRYIILFLLSLLFSIPGVEAAPQEQSYQCHTMDGYFLVKCPHCKQVCPLSVDLC